MADFVFNVAKGRAAQLFKNVDDNSPADAGLTIVVINTTATDATLKDLDTLAAVLADANTAEVTNTGYARIDFSDTDIAFTIDDANDRIDLDIPDPVWAAVSAGDAWTDLLVCYNPDITGDVDANIIPLSLHDFPITPDGSQVTAKVPTSGFFRAA